MNTFTIETRGSSYAIQARRSHTNRAQRQMREARRRRSRMALKRTKRSLAVAACILISFMLGGLLLGTDESVGTEPISYISVVAEPGDSLWSIAREYAPEDVSTRSFIRTIVKDNDLEDESTLMAYQTLRVRV